MKNHKSKVLAVVIFFEALTLAQNTPTFTQNGAKNYLVNTIYFIMKRNAYGYSFSIPVNILSDDAAGGTGTGDGPEFANLDSFKMQTNSGQITGLWSKYYNGISKCNILLEFTKSGENSEIDRYRAEAQFIRASFYFDLVRLFGEVPLLLKADMPLIPDYERATVEEVYMQIEKDLLDAAKSLPIKSKLKVDENFRITLGAAQSLLGKVYLYEQKWQLASDQLLLVINSGEYNLLSKYSDLWVTGNKFSNESIFENYYYLSTTSLYDQTYGNQDARYMSFRGTPGNTFNNGWGFCPIKQSLIDAFKAQNDTVRLNASVLNESDLIKDGCKITKSDSRDYTGYFNKKCAFLKTDMIISNESDKDEIILRYADVLLMYAEAQNKLGNDTESQKYLNKVRNRAKLRNITSTGIKLLEAIQNERQLELAMEANRFFDLVRWGKAENILKNLGYNSYNNILPIPQAEIDKNQNLTQNPGYDGSNNTTQFIPGSVPGNYYTYYKNNLDSLVKYQYDFSKTDSVPFSILRFSKKTSNTMDIKYSEWDISTNKWVVGGWAIDTLDGNGKLLTETTYRYNFTKSTTSQSYWDTLYKYSYTYDLKSYITSYTSYFWNKRKVNNGYVKIWFPQSIEMHYPDDKGNDTLIRYLQYNMTTMKYSTSFKTRYELTYGINGKLSSSIYFYTLNSDTINYIKNSKYIYYYDLNENLIQKDYIYLYGVTTPSLGASEKYILTYNNDNVVISEITQSWSSVTSLYYNELKYDYILNKNNIILISSIYTWDGGFEDWWIGDGKYRSFYYYDNNVVVKNPQLFDDDLNFQIWPNPIKNKVTLNYNSPVAADAIISIYSIDGRNVLNIKTNYQSFGDNKYEIDLSNLQNGMYTIVCKSGKYTSKTRAIVLK